MADSTPSEETVVAITFADPDTADHAVARLRELEGNAQVHIDGLAMVTRNDDGQLIENHLTASPWAGQVSGGLVGVLIGIVGGPLGILLGGSAGLLVGAAADAHDVDEADSALSDIAKSVQIGQTGLVAELIEEDPAILDVAMSGLGARILRRSLDDVEAEVAAADKAQRKAEKEAREQLRRARHEMRKQEAHVRVHELQARLHRDGAAAAVDS